jgi:hypothetical protein
MKVGLQVKFNPVVCISTNGKSLVGECRTGANQACKTTESIGNIHDIWIEALFSCSLDSPNRFGYIDP